MSTSNHSPTLPAEPEPSEPPPDFAHFGEILRAWRKGRGLTLEAAAGLLGCSRNGLQQWESGRRSVQMTPEVWRGVLVALREVGCLGPVPESPDWRHLEWQLVQAVRAFAAEASGPPGME